MVAIPSRRKLRLCEHHHPQALVKHLWCQRLHCELLQPSEAEQHGHHFALRAGQRHLSGYLPGGMEAPGKMDHYWGFGTRHQSGIG